MILGVWEEVYTIYVLDGLTFQEKGKIQVKQQQGGFHVGRSAEIHLAIGDLNSDGNKEIIVGIWPAKSKIDDKTILDVGSISVFNGKTLDKIWESADIGDVTGLTAGNIDDTKGDELIIAIPSKYSSPWTLTLKTLRRR